MTTTRPVPHLGPHFPGRIAVRGHAVSPHSDWLTRTYTAVVDRGHSYPTLRTMAAREHGGVQSTEWTYVLRPTADDFTRERATLVFMSAEAAAFLAYRADFSPVHHEQIVAWAEDQLDELHATAASSWVAQAALQCLASYATEGRLGSPTRLVPLVLRATSALGHADVPLRRALFTRLVSAPGTDGQILEQLCREFGTEVSEFEALALHPNLTPALVVMLVNRIAPPPGAPGQRSPVASPSVRTRLTLALLEQPVLYGLPDTLLQLLSMRDVDASESFRAWLENAPHAFVLRALGAMSMTQPEIVCRLLSQRRTIFTQVISREAMPWLMTLPDSALRSEALTRLGALSPADPIETPLPTPVWRQTSAGLPSPVMAAPR
jgi:hypothetical protein